MRTVYMFLARYLFHAVAYPIMSGINTTVRHIIVYFRDPGNIHDIIYIYQKNNWVPPVYKNVEETT